MKRFARLHGLFLSPIPRHSSVPFCSTKWCPSAFSASQLPWQAGIQTICFSERKARALRSITPLRTIRFLPIYWGEQEGNLCSCLEPSHAKLQPGIFTALSWTSDKKGLQQKSCQTLNYSDATIIFISTLYSFQTYALITYVSAPASLLGDFSV